MITFLTGLTILIMGGFIYGKICEKIINPTDAETPAISKGDGVDYVPMKKWKNSLIELLNIAGTGPILGPIQGILVRTCCVYYYSDWLCDRRCIS